MEVTQNLSTIEMLKQAIKKFDITEDYTLKHKSKVPYEMLFIMDKIKLFFGEYWDENLKEMGITKSMKNYSKLYPINLLKKTDLLMFEDVLEFFGNVDDKTYEFTEVENKQLDDLFADFNLIKLFDFLLPDLQDDSFLVSIRTLFGYYQKCVDDELEKECAILGKQKIEMSVEEKLNVWQKTFDSLNQKGIMDLMIAQGVPEIFDISKDFAEIEDFNNSNKENHPKIDFMRKQYGLRRKFDNLLSFEELTENDLMGLSPEDEITDISDEDFEKVLIGFINNLDDTDKMICYLKMRGKTQSEIAKELGYKNHSAVTKRMAKIKERAIKYCESIEF